MLSHQRRFLWLDAVDRGATVATLARRHHLAIPVVQAAVDDARAQLAAYVEAMRLMRVPLVLFFPINGLFPGSTCKHDRVPIPEGDSACCEVCARSGRDNHPCFDRFPAFEPKPEPAPPVVESAPLTRRQKRAKEHAA